MQKFIIITLAALVLAGCVSTKKYDSMRAHAMRIERELEIARALAAEFEARRSAFQSTIDGLNAEKKALERSLDALTAERNRLHGANSEMRNNYDRMLDDASAETARMLRQIEANQSQLEQSRSKLGRNEEELDKSRRELENNRTELDKSRRELENNRAELENSRRELADRLARMTQLEEALAARDSALERLRSAVSNALLGFEGKGLTVSRRDGKVYVSMDEKLLFRSGSWEIDPKGARAVVDLGGVLAANPDIQIMVEGHTDTVPYRSSGPLKDNLDLSVKRATTVTRLLLTNKGIAPARIVSAGRGEWLPIDPANTDFARSRNRRTEIILSPKLDELLKIAR